MNKRALGCLLEVAETLVLTLIIFFFIQTFVAQPFEVHQQSMLPTFQENDHVLVDKLMPRFDGYSRGDVVVFDPIVRGACDGEMLERIGPDPFIKRVIATAGETVELRDGAVVVDGVALAEPYVHGAQSDPEGPADLTSWVVPAGAVFLMGDNRGNSVDSRSFGPICVRDMIGRAFLRYLPINRLGVTDKPVYDDSP